MANVTLRHLQLGGVHEHRPDGDMAVRAHPDHLHNVQSQDEYLKVNLPTHLGADGLEVRELLTEVPPLAGLQLRQSVIIYDGGARDLNSPIVHEDQDGELADKLLREKQT